MRADRLLGVDVGMKAVIGNRNEVIVPVHTGHQLSELAVGLAIGVLDRVAVLGRLGQVHVVVVGRPHVGPVRMGDTIDERVDVDEQIPVGGREYVDCVCLNVGYLQKVFVEILGSLRK